MSGINDGRTTSLEFRRFDPPGPDLRANRDPKFEQYYYWHILAILNGTKPRPEPYHRFYLDSVRQMLPRPDRAHEPSRFRNLMKDLGFHDVEFANL
jgi:hypothetical protein